MFIDVIAGTRPNFVKVAALFAVADRYPVLHLRLIHTGQHYDANMSAVFLDEFGLPVPACALGVGSGSHAVQTAEIMIRYEQWITAQRPQLVIVVGDVNSTIACALVAAKAGIPVAHVEAGLRSFDRAMPEEINRVLTDSISDLLFASEPSAVENLRREGHPSAQIHLVGNVMIDSLLRMKPKAESRATADQFGLPPNGYAYLTLHRPSNVDDDQQLALICEQITWLSEQLPVIFAVHPRTQSRLAATGLQTRLDAQTNLHLTEPLGYLDSLSVLLAARLVATDSGGLQEESAALGIPCLTLRETTERPVTVSQGTNTLIGHDWALFRRCVRQIIASEVAYPADPIPLWDGQAARRILDVIAGVPQPRSE